MEILATAELQYLLGESISSGWERLEIVVKFKEEGKLFKRKLKSTLASTYHVFNASNSPMTYDEYFGICEEYLNDTYLVKKVAENMIKDYFNKKNSNQLKNNRAKNIQSRASKLGKVEVKVTIK